MSKRPEINRAIGDFNKDTHTTDAYGGAAGLDFDWNRIDTPLPDNAIVPAAGGNFLYKRFTITPTGIIIPENTTPDEWADLGTTVRNLETSIQWATGDWANYAADRWDIPLTDIAEQFGFEPKTLWEYARTCRNISSAIRNGSLSFSHHRIIEGLPDADQYHWLSEAARHNWSVKELRDALRPAASDDPAPSLFDKKQIPKITPKHHKWHIQAQNGNTAAREKLEEVLDDVELWLRRVRESLD